MWGNSGSLHHQRKIHLVHISRFSILNVTLNVITNVSLTIVRKVICNDTGNVIQIVI